MTQSSSSMLQVRYPAHTTHAVPTGTTQPQAQSKGSAKCAPQVFCFCLQQEAGFRQRKGFQATQAMLGQLLAVAHAEGAAMPTHIATAAPGNLDGLHVGNPHQKPRNSCHHFHRGQALPANCHSRHNNQLLHYAHCCWLKAARPVADPAAAAALPAAAAAPAGPAAAFSLSPASSSSPCCTSPAPAAAAAAASSCLG